MQVWLERRYVGTRESSEWFNTAGRNIKTGLIASVIVSQWTWAATILQSSNVAFQVRSTSYMNRLRYPRR